LIICFASLDSVFHYRTAFCVYRHVPTDEQPLNVKDHMVQ